MSPDLTLEMVLALKNRLLAAHVELCELGGDEAISVGLLQAAHELLTVLEDWPLASSASVSGVWLPTTPSASVSGVWWRSDCAWKEALRVLNQLRTLKKTRAHVEQP